MAMKPTGTAKTSAASKKATPAAGKTTAARKKPAAAKSTKASATSPKTANAYKGSCHCGRIVLEVTGTIDQVMDCNCSMCQRRGGLLWFVPRSAMRLVTPESNLWTYTFNKHVLQHHFCANCGVAPFSEGEKKGEKMAAINVRCLEDIDLSKLKW